MTADSTFFSELAYVFLAAVLGGGLARLARQPLIIGYVVGGIAIGPFTPGPAVSPSGLHTFEVLAEIGVILLMYSVGLEFSLRDLLRARCTMVVARLLMDRGELRSRHGRVMIGITLVEDLAVVVLTILVPALGAPEPARLIALAVAFGKAALILVPFAYLAAKVVPAVMTRVARTQSQELFLLVALAIPAGDGVAGRGGADADRRVFLRPGAGRPVGRPRRRRHLQRDPGDLPALDPHQDDVPK